MNVQTISFFGLSQGVPLREDIIDVLRGVAVNTEPSRWPSLWDGIAALLLSSRSAKVRNAAALALADLQYPKLADTLNSLLARRDVAETAGTLLFVMEQSGQTISFEVVLNIVEFGSYESRAELMLLLDAGRLEPLDEAHRRALGVELARLAASAEEGVAEASRIASDVLCRAP